MVHLKEMYHLLPKENHKPIASMYCISTYSYHKDQTNVGKYTSPMDGNRERYPVSISGNLHCDAELLRNVDPPYDGQLLPSNFTLVERIFGRIFRNGCFFLVGVVGRGKEIWEEVVSLNYTPVKRKP